MGSQFSKTVVGESQPVDYGPGNWLRCDDYYYCFSTTNFRLQNSENCWTKPDITHERMNQKFKCHENMTAFLKNIVLHEENKEKPGAMIFDGPGNLWQNE